jgi:hypothetical protein
VEDRQQIAKQRQQRHAEINDNMNLLTDRQQFWADHPRWARWRVTRPYRWATAAAIGGWFSWGAAAPVYYDYGENVYYEDNVVYYGDQQVATAEEYTEQAQEIATSAPEVGAETEWMSLGVFALTPDVQSASSGEPTIFLQLVLSKEGVINGTVQNTTVDESQQIEGAVDQESKRAAWVISGKTSPIMETGIYNLTKDDAPALLHFSDGQTQQWLLVRLDEPEAGK